MYLQLTYSGTHAQGRTYKNLTILLYRISVSSLNKIASHQLFHRDPHQVQAHVFTFFFTLTECCRFIEK